MLHVFERLPSILPGLCNQDNETLYNLIKDFMQHFFFLIFLFLSAYFFAKLEIQIEGKDGWAGNLPTWRKPPYKNGLLKLLTDPNQPLTGYHAYLWLFILVISHFVFLLVSWTVRAELYILSYYTLLTTLEDFLWFIFNPHYGLKKFKKGEILWHTYWLLGVPRIYWINYPLGIILYLIGSGII